MTPDQVPPNDVELARYLSGECSPEEAARLTQRLAMDIDAVHRLDALRAVWRVAEEIAPSWNTEKMWAKVKPLDRAPAAPSPSPASWSLRFAPWWRLPAVAAGLLVAAGTGLWLTSRSEPAADPMREVVTTAGQRAEVRLGDGSRVILGVDSRLRFPVTLGKHSRDLELFGQAYFEVQHDPNRPFRVRSGGVITEDLGTEFVVRAYAGDSTVRVAVVSGQVSVRPSNGTASASPTMLAEGDLATVTEDGLPSVTHDVNVESYLGWTKGRIEFRGTGLAEVARDLGRWYGLEIRLASPALERLRLTATFRNEPIEQVLHLITASLDLSADRAGDTVTLRLK